MHRIVSAAGLEIALPSSFHSFPLSVVCVHFIVVVAVCLARSVLSCICAQQLTSYYYFWGLVHNIIELRVQDKKRGAEAESDDAPQAYKIQ